VRGAALVLVITLVGPSVGSLVCDWLCVASHEPSTSTESCHESATDGSLATLEAENPCHDRTFSTASILTSPAHVELRALPAAAPLSDDVRASALVPNAARRSGAAHAPPPPPTPLRI